MWTYHYETVDNGYQPQYSICGEVILYSNFEYELSANGLKELHRLAQQDCLLLNRLGMGWYPVFQIFRIPESLEFRWGLSIYSGQLSIFVSKTFASQEAAAQDSQDFASAFGLHLNPWDKVESNIA